MSGAVADDKEFGPEVSSRGGGDGEPKSGRIVDARELLDAMTCPVSGLVFVDPVTTTCGHTFSRQSLARWMTSTGSNQRDGAGPTCPTCRAPLYHESPHQWPVNTVLVDLAAVVLVQVKAVNLVEMEPKVVVLVAVVLTLLLIMLDLDLGELFMLLIPHCNRRTKCQSTLSKCIYKEGRRNCRTSSFKPRIKLGQDSRFCC